MRPRIVSLLPSATEIVCALGLRSSLVGRSHECDYPDDVASLPACTRTQVDASGTSAEIHASVSSLFEHRLSVYDIDEALLRKLRPTHIVTQIQCEVCAVSLQDVHQTLQGWNGAAPEVISLRAMTLEAVFDDIRRVASSLFVADRGRELIAESRRRIGGIAGPWPRRRVVGIEWLDPLMGTGNWVPELIELAGGIDPCTKPGQHSRWLNWKEILTADPELLILFPCGFPMEKTEEELNREEFLRFDGEIFIADGNQFFNRPGPRLVETLEILAEILQPQRFDFGHRGRSWKRWQPAR